MKNGVTKTSEGTIQEERYTIIIEPRSQYLDHVTRDDGSARFIASKLITEVPSLQQIAKILYKLSFVMAHLYTLVG